MNIISIDNENEKSHVCEQILRSLPEWFGIESAILDYIKDVQRMETWGAQVDGKVIGFLSVHKHNKATAEIHVMGVREEFHRKGVGRKLVAKAEASLASDGFKFLTVKTLSESRPDAGYDRTRQFYLNIGFSPIEEFKTLWGPANPCLLLLKSLSISPGTKK
jgi:ribosomal protein S18 acetylase RimI-like enzyme